MKPEKRILALFPALILIALLGAHAPHVAAEEPTVLVDWTDPSQFSEMKMSGGLDQSNPEAWLGEFASTIRRRADKDLKAGQTLSVTFTNVLLAGTVRSGRASSGVRVVGKNSPPEISLRFTVTGADGQVIASGNRDLRDPGVMTTSLPGNSDPYTYEVKMLRNWMDKEFGDLNK